MNSRKLFTGLACLSMAASLAACSSNNASQSTGGASNQTLIAGTTQQLNGIFNPIYYVTAYDGWVINMVYQSMTSVNAQGEMVPQLATELPSYSEDGKTLTFKLKEGSKFSNGSDLNANDIRYTFTLMADPAYVGERLDGNYKFIEGWDAYQKGDATEVSGIKVVDDYTITFTLAEPNIDASEIIGTTYILPDDQFEYKKGNLDVYKSESSKPIGSGPYELVSYDKSTGAALQKNQKFTGEGAYKIEKVIVKTIGASTELSSLQNGDINFLPEMIEPQIVGPASLDSNLAIDHYFRPAEGYVGFNCANGPTADAAVRQALSYAFPRQEFIDTYFKWPEKDGKSEVSESLKDVKPGYVPTAFWTPVASVMGDITTGKTDLEGLVVYDYDMEKAKQTLEEAGWTVGSDGIREKDGQKLTIKFLLSQDNSVLETLVPMLQKSWTELGVDLKQNTVDFNTLISTVEVGSSEPLDGWSCFFLASSFTGLGNTEMNNLLGYQGEASNPQYMGSNYVRIADPELNEYLKAGKYTSDSATSIENYKKAMIRESQLAPYVALYGNQLFNIGSTKIKGLKAGSVCSWSSSLADAYIE